MLAAFGCATQAENGDMPDGASGSSSSGSTSGGSSSGSGGSKATGGTSSGSGNTQAGTSNGGSPGAGSGGSDDGGSAGMSTGGTGGTSAGAAGKAGAGGSSGSAGAGGKGGSGGTAGSAGNGGSGGTPVDTCKNGDPDGDETDVDCGGKVCTARCAVGKGCDVVTDCVQTPTGNVCDEDSCRANGCTTDNCAYALTRLILGTSAARGQAFVTWDSDSLDMLIEMLDATVQNDSDLNWEDDSVEIYLDLNNAGSASYEPANDFQITVPRAAGALSGTANYTMGAIVVNRTDGASGYTLEISIPWNALNGAASPVGSTIGFDIGVNDDTNGATRDSQLMLYGNDQNYQNTSAFGELVLTP